MIKKIIFLLLIYSTCSAQAPSIQWEQTYGGGQMDEANSLFNDQYGTIWIAGMASSDALVFSIDHSGNQNWLKRFGGSNGNEYAAQILKSFNGNLVFAGSASSTDGDVIGLHGGNPFTGGPDDYWIVCLDTSGNIVWQNCLGGTFYDEATSIIQTPDSGYLVFGIIGSNDGQITTYYGINDLWIAKLSKTGILLWSKTFGGSNDEIAGKLISTSDGGLIFCSSSQSYDHDVVSNIGGYDVWVAKLSSVGVIQWQHNYGGTGDDIARDIVQTNDGGYFLIGNTNSVDGDITDPKGQGDILVMKIDSLGNLQWSRCEGGSQNEIGYSGCITSNGVEVVGYTDSNDSIFTSNHGLSDIAAFEIDNNGNMLWSKCIGGSDFDQAYSIVSTPDGGSAIAGYTLSSDGDVSVPNAGNEQAWVIKLSANPVFVPEKNQMEASIGGLIKNETLYFNYFLKASASGVLSLFDFNGKRIFEKKINLNSSYGRIQVPCNVANGVYMIRFENKNEILANKVISIGE